MPVTAMLTRWIGGWDEVTDDGDARFLYGRREACLGLGAQQSLAEARRVTRAQLAVMADTRTEMAAAVVPIDAADTPWLAYRTGDHLTVPDWNRTPTEERVISLGGAVDANGLVTFSIEVHDRILGDRERAEQAAKKMTNGTLRGASKVATPTGLVGKRNIPAPPPLLGG